MTCSNLQGCSFINYPREPTSMILQVTRVCCNSVYVTYQPKFDLRINSNDSLVRNPLLIPFDRCCCRCAGGIVSAFPSSNHPDKYHRS